MNKERTSFNTSNQFEKMRGVAFLSGWMPVAAAQHSALSAVDSSEKPLGARHVHEGSNNTSPLLKSGWTASGLAQVEKSRRQFQVDTGFLHSAASASRAGPGRAVRRNEAILITALLVYHLAANYLF